MEAQLPYIDRFAVRARRVVLQAPDLQAAIDQSLGTLEILHGQSLNDAFVERDYIEETRSLILWWTLVDRKQVPHSWFPIFRGKGVWSTGEFAQQLTRRRVA